jgi:hypothetical protein
MKTGACEAENHHPPGGRRSRSPALQQSPRRWSRKSREYLGRTKSRIQSGQGATALIKSQVELVTALIGIKVIERRARIYGIKRKARLGEAKRIIPPDADAFSSTAATTSVVASTLKGSRHRPSTVVCSINSMANIRVRFCRRCNIECENGECRKCRWL